ncbi:telomere repeat-binding factor 5-like [Raphanus sativus]|uniref:Telomere repeat-binding factor 5-like n=1 Tax=Raphanus sativus TaxID=3726 RepID=A0A6J0KLX9_RAPSA|nr:telomere repeat-binding factor 5-like [Raphanus sativus]
MDPDAADSSSDEDSSSKDTHVDDPVREAISTINDGNGVDIDGIYEFVKARHSLMPNYREVLEAELILQILLQKTQMRQQRPSHKNLLQWLILQILLQISLVVPPLGV